MKITENKLDELYSLYDELAVARALQSNKIAEAKQNKENEIEVEREDGTQKVTEGDLWEEVRHLGVDCPAGEALKEKYPDTFEAAERYQKKANELQKFTTQEFGIDSQAIRMSDIFRMTEAMVEYKSLWRTILRKIKKLFS